MGQGPKGQGGRGGTPELISANEKPKKTGPLSPAGKQWIVHHSRDLIVTGQHSCLDYELSRALHLAIDTLIDTRPQHAGPTGLKDRFTQNA